MSTKIYNGYKLQWDGQPSLSVVMDYLVPFGEVIRKRTETLYGKILTNIAVEAIDSIALGRPVPQLKTETSPLVYAQLEIAKRQKEVKATSQRDPAVDFEFKVLLIPTADKILAMLYTEQAVFIKQWEALPIVTKYPYWNNSDHPSGISAKAWDARGEEWNAALGERGIPSHRGVTFDPTDAYMPLITAQRALHFMPTLQARVNNFASDMLFYDYRTLNPRAKPRDVMEVYWECREWQKTEEGQAALKVKENEIKARIKPKLTKEDLLEIVPVGQVAAQGVRHDGVIA